MDSVRCARRLDSGTSYGNKLTDSERSMLKGYFREEDVIREFLVKLAGDKPNEFYPSNQSLNMSVDMEFEGKTYILRLGSVFKIIDPGFGTKDKRQEKILDLYERFLNKIGLTLNWPVCIENSPPGVLKHINWARVRKENREYYWEVLTRLKEEVARCKNLYSLHKTIQSDKPVFSFMNWLVSQKAGLIKTKPSKDEILKAISRLEKKSGPRPQDQNSASPLESKGEDIKSVKSEYPRHPNKICNQYYTYVRSFQMGRN